MLGVAVAGDVDGLEMLEERRTVVPRRALGALDHVVAVQRADRDDRHIVDPEAAGEHPHPLGRRAEPRLVPLDEVHLVDARDDVADPEQGRDLRVTARLGHDAAAGVDEHDREVGRRGAGEHVARVALVAGRVGEDERAPRRGEEPVRDVDRDALLALGPQAVGDGREVGLLPVARDGVELVAQQELRVEQEAPDQRRLAVVDRARGRQAQQLAGRRGGGRHQK